MEVRLNPDLQTKLVQLASQRGRDTEALVVEALGMVNYDEWFIPEVEKEVAAADRGELIEHSDVMRIHASENNPATARNKS